MIRSRIRFDERSRLRKSDEIWPRDGDSRRLAETGGYEVTTCMYRDVTVDRWLCIFDVLGR